ncbi:MAG: hypothetical protein L3J79_11725 [Candidatus Marinimicrobia bacterium]|nr:hypothetical protein [Candidatus Neomarinimicrobiota bacterium]
MTTIQSNRVDAELVLESVDPMINLTNDLNDLGLDLDNDIAVIAFLGCIARRFGEAQWILFTGESGCGKTFLRSVIRDCVPVEERLSYEYATEKALLYRAPADGGHLDLSQYVLIGDERKSGKDDHAYLRTLYSEKSLEYSVAKVDGTMTLKLKGRPALLETTTDSGISIEDQNRRMILVVDESVQKKEKIVEYKNKVAARSLDIDPAQITGIYQEVQRMLPQVECVQIPYSEGIVPRVQSLSAISRVHDQLLTTTKAIALMRHKKRHIDKKLLICELEDYDLAHYLLSPLHNALVSGVEDQERDMILSIQKKVSSMPMANPKKKKFTTNDIGEWTGLGRGTRERRIKKAVESGLLRQVTAGRRGVAHEYELGDVQAILTQVQLFPSSQELRASGYR